jgi:hypothetical protein
MGLGVALLAAAAIIVAAFWCSFHDARKARMA